MQKSRDLVKLRTKLVPQIETKQLSYASERNELEKQYVIIKCSVCSKCSCHTMFEFGPIKKDLK